MTETGAPNLDCMTTADLYAFVEESKGLRPRSLARKLFPDHPKGLERATRDLHNYAWNKITAMACRGRGDVSTALHYEAICDRIYNKLPEFARW